ncbi:MAG: imidazole glycerol phosphate synthase subunit HisH [Oscillospiraceae bacterium]|nr:imidazole glycerol phosphate synthase subunit HisH [Oscillospiraceae bacterium]
MIAIVDYGAGNLGSVQKALAYLGAPHCVSADADTIRAADAVILPGVGAFGDAMGALRTRGLVESVQDFARSGKPFLGICLGYQVLFAASDESPDVAGLGLLPGTVRRIPAQCGDTTVKVPHMGWNSLRYPKKSALFGGVPDDAYVYFVHSYFVQAQDPAIIAATTDYSTRMDVAVAEGNLLGTQFHPEKSGKVGLQILRNFVELSTR